MGYRYYNPNYGRFTQPDPTRQEANPYAYANGDPINGSDPTGASLLKGIGDLFGAVGAAIVGGSAAASCPETIGAGCGVAVASFGAGLTFVADAETQFSG
jgi:hypothetical protein